MNFHTFVLYIIAKIYMRLVKQKVEERDKFIKILINISSGIGDALMAEPLVRALKEEKPQIKIDILAGRSTNAMYENNKCVNRVFLLELGLLKIFTLIRMLRKQHYDAFIGTIPSNTLSQIFIPYLSNIPFRIKHRTPHSGSRDFDFLFHRIESIPEGRHRIECNLDLSKHLNINQLSFEKSPRFPVSEDTLEITKKKLFEKRYNENKLTIGFHPGCNPQASFKRWAPENYARLMHYLQEQWKAEIVIVGGKDEEDDVRHIEALLPMKPLNFVGQADLFETAAFIRHCKFFISNDSGIMHLATAVDVPVFAIFGPKDERHIGPYGAKHTVIRQGTDVNNVTVEQVIDTLLQSEFGLKHFNNV